MADSTLAKVHAIVPCAGSGTRYDSERLKQYDALNGVPLVERAIAPLLNGERVDSVTVALAEGDAQFSGLSSAGHVKLRCCTGGATRAESVLNGLLDIQALAQPQDWVLVHDAARPLLTPVLLERLLDAVENHEVGGLLCIPIHDTVKQISSAPDQAAGEGSPIEKTLDRTQLLAAQTPQIFRYHLLRNALSLAVKAGDAITDEAAAIERLGYQPLAVEGCSSNIKVTTQADIKLASFHLQAGPEAS